MRKRKEFSVLKWIVFPLNSVTLAAIVVYFNITVFGYRDGLPYSLIVCLIGVFSVIINKYTESDNRNLARAAFIFEIILTAALIANACYSVSVQRKMSVARMAETSQADTIDKISKLRGSRTQREALKVVDKPQSSQSVFADVENILFWIMAAELALYGLSAFVLFALAKLTDESREAASEEDEFPAELDTKKQSLARRPNLTPKTTTSGDVIDDTRDHRKTTPDGNPPGLRELLAALKLISFAHPPGHFKAGISKRGDYLIIRRMRSERGDEYTTHSVRAKLSLLDDALKTAPAAFRDRLERFLRENGFEI